jgi:hypothetical protein
MNLLYAAFLREDSGQKGVIKKIKNQCESFRKEIDDVFLYISRSSESILYKLQYGEFIEMQNFKYRVPAYDGYNKIRKLGNYFAYNSFLKSLKYVIEVYNIDILYYRLSPPSKKLINILENKNLIKLIEIPTYPFQKEFKNSKTKVEYLLFWKYGFDKMKNYADIIIGISSNKYLDLEKDNKVFLIRNGIQLEGLNIIRKKEKSWLNLLSISSLNLWHGYDRIIKGLHEYYKINPEKEVFYHCVGEGPELTNLKKLTKELNLEKYVIFHGTKIGEDLDKVVDESDIAFGSLGLHRIGAGCPLKNREYCARGIPFVIASDDQDFPETFPFVYSIPKDETPVDINQVIKWYESLIKEYPNYSIEMRKFAEENLSWDAKMKPVIEKIKELAKEKGIPHLLLEKHEGNDKIKIDYE